MMSGLRNRIAPHFRRIYRILGPRRRGFRALILHHIPNEEVSAFESLLDYLDGEHGFISPEEAEKVLAGEAELPESRTPILLTFDDGFVSNYEVAQSVLKPRGVRAIFFVCPGLIDQPAAEQREAVRGNIFPAGTWTPPWPIPRLVTWSELRTMNAAGHAIGSHSMMHRRLSRLILSELESDVKSSISRIAEELGKPPRWFAYPFGSLDSTSEEVFLTVAKHSTFCCSGVRGLNTAGTHRTAVLREGIDLTASLDYLKLTVDGGLDMFYRSRRRRLSRMVEGVSHHAGSSQ